MRRVGTYLWRIVYVVTILLLGSNRWGDRSLYPDRWNHPVEIHVVSHGYHSGLVIPREALIRLSERGNRGPKDDFLGKVAGRFAAYSWIEIGWGEARFYREVPTVDALTVRLALSALRVDRTRRRAPFASPRLRGEGRRRRQACAAGEGEGAVTKKVLREGKAPFPAPSPRPAALRSARSAAGRTLSPQAGRGEAAPFNDHPSPSIPADLTGRPGPRS